MKKLVVILIATFATLQLSAQDAITNYFGQYESDESYSHVSITSRMFSLFTDLEVEDKEDQEILNAISKLEGLKILATEEAKDGKKLYQNALSRLPKGEYDELMSVRDDDKDMKFMIKEKGKKISELVMIMGGEKEFFVLTLFGEIDLKQIAKISSAMDIDGLEGLEKLKDKN